jgi:hypothetical protein
VSVRALALLALVFVTLGPALAEPPLTSLRPMPRPMAQSVRLVSALAPLAVPRPMRRPPLARIWAAAAVKTKADAALTSTRKGALCGDPDVRGQVLPLITSKVAGCGIANPVRVTSVAGVPLSQPATLDCAAAVALKSWVVKGLKPAFGKTGGGVARLNVAAHYACRTRNSQSGARVSEHGRGKAIDISGITLANGQTVTIKDDWRKSQGKPLKKAHKAACGTFGTTLGPGSDGFHEDHMHFDVARYRGGPYCK